MKEVAQGWGMRRFLVLGLGRWELAFYLMVSGRVIGLLRYFDISKVTTWQEHPETRNQESGIRNKGMWDLGPGVGAEDRITISFLCDFDWHANHDSGWTLPLPPHLDTRVQDSQTQQLAKGGPLYL